MTTEQTSEISDQINFLNSMNHSAIDLATINLLSHWNLYRVTSPFQLRDIIKLSKMYELDVFCPFELIVKRDNKHSKKKTKRISPLFPGYFYLHESQRLPSTVNKLLFQPMFLDGNQMSSKSSELINFYNTINTDYNKPSIFSLGLKLGDRVIIEEGPFQWIEGSIIEHEDGVCKVSIEFMNSQQILSFPVSFLKKV